MVKPKPRPFQPLATEIETVSAATGIDAHRLPHEILEGLAKGLAHTTSPLKDAVDHLLSIKALGQRRRELLATLDDMSIDINEQMERRSCLESIEYHWDVWNETIEELMEISFQLI